MTENVIENPAPKSVAIKSWGQEEVAPHNWAAKVLGDQTDILEANGWQITERQRDLAYLSALETLDAEVLRRPLRGRGQPSPLYASTIHQITATELRKVAGQPAPVKPWERVTLGLLVAVAAITVGLTWKVGDTASGFLRIDDTLWLGPQRQQTAANWLFWLGQTGAIAATLLLVPALVTTGITLVRRVRPRYTSGALALAIAAAVVCMATVVTTTFIAIMFAGLGR
ncbi:MULTISPECIES: hypothetical protein [unclassified Rhodococcus (in: high G+C Gram-positive bacteria)]|uniref:hypothetical protein n=1 Tax=unclassified Rhodococcus (in: high G+C Gram-positive bacteria) TaxID=192944 RepID=UPI00163B05C0|nr:MULTISPECIES: hypothetical protein [unclassified Rhodococcus (in: high G+C Gram-positive bacteria)]MBC2644305.1 hypothetical protein [Rhodococcus sp. 3A]MBC2898002.1 hypothetical protein [Rhodococcus sp. 4CII]